jgi:hypothetical protein
VSFSGRAASFWTVAAVATEAKTPRRRRSLANDFIGCVLGDWLHARQAADARAEELYDLTAVSGLRRVFCFVIWTGRFVLDGGSGGDRGQHAEEEKEFSE